ncbi:MAG: hypothetical protein IT583_06925 [Verrucomicrobia bacterium]|nr:hypothetical protein [Verrucomicrobiota bacterium]
MSLQVNLLKKIERRYQGIVSMKVIVLGSVCVLAGTTILVFSLTGISRMTLKANLDRARREWTILEPQAAVVRKEQAAIAANAKMRTDLETWAKGDHPSMFSILRSVQRQVPPQMALENLFAGQENDLVAGTSQYILRFSGRAQGELTAVEAKRQINTDAGLRRFCGEIKLVSSQRAAGEIWIFAMEGHRPVAGGDRK